VAGRPEAAGPPGTGSVVIRCPVSGVPVLATDVPVCGPGTSCRCERDPPRSRWCRIDRHRL